MKRTFEEHAAKMRARAIAEAAQATELPFKRIKLPVDRTPMARHNSYCADDWLWKFARQRTQNQKDRARNLAAHRMRGREANRRYRERLREGPRNALIRAVYWHEVYNPCKPFRAFGVN
jgi:pullulanase/glycogen debranching enzyme